MSPTVQRGNEVLRICLHAFNTENELRTLLELIEYRLCIESSLQESGTDVGKTVVSAILPRF